MHPWVKGTQICSNAGPCPFPRGDNYKNSKNTLTKFKKSSGPISTKLGKMHPLVKGTQICSNEGPSRIQMGDNYKIAKIH